MSGPERKVEQLLIERVRELGGQCIKFAPIVAGAPDRLVLLPPGRIRLVETKAPRGKLRPDQRVWHKRARKIGIEVVVLGSVEQVEEWVRRLDLTES